MLTQKDKIKILELREQGFSYKAIHESLGFAIDTIMKVCNEKEEKSGKTEEDQIKREVMSLGSAELEVRKIDSDIDNLIKSGRLKDVEKKKYQKLKEVLRTILREEADDVRAAAVETRDEEWNEFIKQNYVKKEVATSLSNTIKGKDLEIRNLKAAVKGRDNILSEKQSEISQIKASHHFEKQDLKDWIRNLRIENQFLKDENDSKQNYIENRLDVNVRQGQLQVYNDQDTLNSEKTKFNEHVKAQLTKLNTIFIDLVKREKNVERREGILAEWKEELKKQRQELKTAWVKMVENKNNLEKLQKDLDNQPENIKKRWKNVIKKVAELRNKEKQLQKWQEKLEKTGGFNKFSLPCPHCRKPKLFDATEPELNQKLTRIFGNYMHPECRQKKPELVTLIPVSYRGTPVVRSGFSPVIKSGGEPKVIMYHLEPVVQSGFPATIKSGDESDVFVTNDNPILRSGVST